MRSLRALARTMGLSPATVSRALSGHPHVHRDVRARVLTMAAAHGIASPQAGAGSGRRLVAVVAGRSWATGGAAASLTELLAGATQGARQAGAHLATIVLDQAPPEGILAIPDCARLRPSAALLVHWSDVDAIAAASARLPCVLVGQSPPDAVGSGVRCASFDAIDGVLRLLDHLLALGHRRLAMLTDRSTGWRGCERHGAAASAAALRGLQLPLLRLDADQGWERVHAAHRRGVTGWIVGSQATGEALYSRLAAWGARIPAEVSICSFSFTPPAPGRPRLTGMRGDWQAVGRIAARWALTRPDPIDPVTRLLVRSRVEPGDTTGPVPAIRGRTPPRRHRAG